MNIFQLLGLPTENTNSNDLKRIRRPIQHPPVLVSDIYVTRTSHLHSLCKRALSLILPVSSVLKQGKQNTRVVDVIRELSGMQRGTVSSIDVTLHGVGRMADKCSTLAQMIQEKSFNQICIKQVRKEEIELVDDYVHASSNQWQRSEIRRERAVHIIIGKVTNKK